MSGTHATLSVALGDRSYDIHVGRGLLETAGDLLAPVLRSPKVVVVTDGNLIRTPHPDRLAATLAASGIESRRLVVPPGEASKCWERLIALLDDLLDHRAERSLTVVALGGGVIGDLAGFAASILLRGVDLVQVPTSLLAQVDSAVGGKTGIDTRQGKNLVGAFHQPVCVLIDTDVLADLPARELRAGYAEVVKYGIICDAAFFAWLEERGGRILEGDAGLLREAIMTSLRIKAEVVGEDERETSGRRALLNLGHTFAHGLERIAGFDGRLLHGEAVSIGLVMAAEVSVRLGLCQKDDARRIRGHLRSVGLPVAPKDVTGVGFTADAMLDAMASDKKTEGGRIRFVLLRAIGDAFPGTEVDPDILRSFLDDAIES